ncbi:dihydroorotase [Gottfriedia solisilvae]|uniref:Dihydroorotase n=1 Tax=Gottfriedia solisilvae TaxID=1516104 RepID=A0A8J3EYX5_9BACI|nr:dihydroorotase [Gottfriedia solisilvae]GGI14374.1 dihydroorotase [Gottfriedia solisilvae]
MKYLFKNGVILQENGELLKRDVLVVNEKISVIAETIIDQEATIIELEGKLLSPGFIDVHVHLREPGGEHKETIETGTKAAARGGFTTIAAMPNTRPVPDTIEHLQSLNKKIEDTALVNVLPYASITIRQAGEEQTDFETLKNNGAFAFTDDGVGVQSAEMMYKAMQKAAELNVSIVAHCEENTLIQKGCVHEGKFSKENDLNGIPSICESVQIARDVLLAEATGCHYHVCHISTKESVRVVRDAKKAGINVTAEVSPHHLILCEDDIPGLDTNFKMNPPLRGALDRESLIEGLLDGTIDMIATDHAPHTPEEKAQGMQLAPFGIVGLETAFPLLNTHFVQTGKMSLKQLIDFMTVKPAEVFKINRGKIEVGAVADLTVIDLELQEEIDSTTFLSKGKNTPFDGWKCKGWPVMTMVKGKLVYESGEVTV